MSTTQAQAEVMHQVASRFDDAQQQLQTMLTQLLREVEAAKAVWQGRGGASFEQASVAWAEQQRRLLTALAQTATAVRTAGTRYEHTDAEVAGRLTMPAIDLPL